MWQTSKSSPRSMSEDAFIFAAEVLERLSDRALEFMASQSSITRESLLEALALEAARIPSRSASDVLAVRAWASSPELFCLLAVRSSMCTDQINMVVGQFCNGSPDVAAQAMDRIKAIPGLSKFFDVNRAVRRFHGLALRRNSVNMGTAMLGMSYSPHQPLLPQQVAAPVMAAPLLTSPVMLPVSMSPPEHSRKIVPIHSSFLQTPSLLIGKIADFIKVIYRKGHQEYFGYELYADRRVPFIVDQSSLMAMQSKPKFATGIIEAVYTTRATGDEPHAFPAGSEIHTLRVSFKNFQTLSPSRSPPVVLSTPKERIPVIPASWMEATNLPGDETTPILDAPPILDL